MHSSSMSCFAEIICDLYMEPCYRENTMDESRLMSLSLSIFCYKFRNCSSDTSAISWSLSIKGLVPLKKDLLGYLSASCLDSSKSLMLPLNEFASKLISPILRVFWRSYKSSGDDFFLSVAALRGSLTLNRLTLEEGT
jgi:hypothetical protein